MLVQFISDEKLNTVQIQFVELIIDYVVTNGMIKSSQIFIEDTFRDVEAIMLLSRVKLVHLI